ncbi:MAG: hypothetical protein RIQ88_30 [Actinomycetota bacterium]|jgi:hypothetical protein
MAKRNLLRLAQSLPNGSVVADFSNYEGAVKYVEQMLKGDFPASAVAIVGTNLSTVERVRGKINYAKVALNGASLGLWIGLVLYFIFGTSNQPNQTGQISLLPALLVGAGIGMLWQIVRFALMRNKRSFTSSSQIVASKYEVLVPNELTSDAEAAYLKGGQVED